MRAIYFVIQFGHERERERERERVVIVEHRSIWIEYLYPKVFYKELAQKKKKKKFSVLNLLRNGIKANNS